MNTSNKWIYENSETSWGENQAASLNRWEQDVLRRYLQNKEGRILEGCCGGGRISKHLYEWGFKNIEGFDFVEDFIREAQSSAPFLHFFVADARDLSMIPDNSFDYVIYLQQCICFIPVEGIKAALEENYRVCKSGGTAVFSFLDFNGRGVNRILGPLLSVLRWARHEDLSPQQLPWLRLRGKPNWNFWRKGQATNYWFTKSEIVHHLQCVGYDIVELYNASDDANSEGMIYVVCKKP